jgi:PKD repeat protein
VEKPEQPFIQAPDSVVINEEILMNGSKTYFKDYTISNYYWDFGDGARTSGVNVKHRFEFPGTFEVKLGVTGENVSGAKNPSGNNCVSRKIVVVNPGK